MRRIDEVKTRFPQLTTGTCRFGCADCHVFLHTGTEVFSCSTAWGEKDAASEPDEITKAVTSITESILARHDHCTTKL